MILLQCPGCQQRLQVPGTAAGKQARCPRCQQLLAIPAAGVPRTGPIS